MTKIKTKEYFSVDDIPLHCFSNKECTMTPSPELRQYLKWMLANHPNDLYYLYNYGQQYKKFGGCYVMTFEFWLDKLTKDLQKQENQVG